MRSHVPFISMHATSVVRPYLLFIAAFTILAALNTQLLAGQAPASDAPASSATAPPHPHTSSHHPHKPQAAVVAAPVPVDPPPPNWPMNDKPAPASVNWDGSGLRIIAANSSLQQILDEVSKDTGAKVEGIGQDQRIFGDFGPGRARDVIAQLLLGSGYNFLLVGESGPGLPREIVLSTRGTPSTAPRANPAQSQADDTEDTPDPIPPDPQPPVNQPPQQNQPPQGPPRTPQQLMQEMQMRQQQMQQQQQQNQQPTQQPNE
ncbi:MAG TPA: hypothetical protein VK716_05315 [Terracidiphilus sp.]|jgi:hypothetical protein|nr:hypothetical protein [Terracidiphilus sp.]